MKSLAADAIQAGRRFYALHKDATESRRARRRQKGNPSSVIFSVLSVSPWFVFCRFWGFRIHFFRPLYEDFSR
jgi:hypothetical protein